MTPPDSRDEWFTRPGQWTTDEEITAILNAVDIEV
jgi:hypothetical protein